MFKTGLLNPSSSREFKGIESKPMKRLDLRPWKGQVVVVARPRRHIGWCDLSDTLKSEKFKELVCEIVENCTLPPISKPMTIPNC